MRTIEGEDAPAACSAAGDLEDQAASSASSGTSAPPPHTIYTCKRYSSGMRHHVAPGTDRTDSSNYFVGDDRELHALPTDVGRLDQLASLPKEYLTTSDDVEDHHHCPDQQAPLQSADEFGNRYHHVLRPLFHSVIFILLVEAMEQFAYYGVAFTQQLYMTGEYSHSHSHSYAADDDANTVNYWNANFTSVQASTIISASAGITSTATFLGGILADVWLGDYWVIVGGMALFFIPGLLLIALTAYPQLLGMDGGFNTHAFMSSLLALYPLGSGAIISVVFGAKQYHPILQSSFLEQYFITFYLCINIGSLLGGFIVPSVAKYSNIFAAYMIPVVASILVLITFLAMTKRYIRMKPNGKVMVDILKVMFGSLLCWSSHRHSNQESTKPMLKPAMPGLEKLKESSGGRYEDSFVESVRRLLYVIPVSALVMPFTIVFNQLSTVFITQGEVMRPAGPFDAALMQNFGPISVILSGLLASRVIYPALSRRGIHLAITTKFAIGCSFATLAIVVALIIEYRIRTVYQATGESISIIWQTFSFVFVGCGEMFSISSSIEATYVIAPKPNKGLASAINDFLTMGTSSFIAAALYNACRSFFTNDAGTTDLGTLELYNQAEVYRYWFVMLAIGVFGILLNLLPPVKKWVDRVASESRCDTARTSLRFIRHSRRTAINDIESDDDQ